jgi:hypothetical protein
MALFVLVALPALDAHAEEPFDIRPHWKAGQCYYIEFDWRRDIKYLGENLPEESRHRRWSAVEGWWEQVDSISSNGTVHLTLTFDHLAANYGNDPSLRYDSDQDDRSVDTNEIGETYRPMIGKRLTVEVDAKGKVVSVHGMEDIYAQIARTVGSNSYLAYMRQTHGDDYIKFLEEQVLAMYAFESKEPGDTWTRRIEHKGIGYDCEYELDSEEKLNGRPGLAIAYHCQLDSRAHDDSKERQKKDGWRHMRAKVSGQAFYDRARGMIVHGEELDQSESEQALTLEGHQGPVWAKTASKGQQTLRCLTVAERRKEVEANHQKSGGATEKKP